MTLSVAESSWSHFRSVGYHPRLQLRSCRISKSNREYKHLNMVWNLLKNSTYEKKVYPMSGIIHSSLITLLNILFNLLSCPWCFPFKFLKSCHLGYLVLCHLLILYLSLMPPSNFFINLFLFSVLISCALSTVSRSSISFHRNLFWFMIQALNPCHPLVSRQQKIRFNSSSGSNVCYTLALLKRHSFPFQLMKWTPQLANLMKLCRSTQRNETQFLVYKEFLV